MSFPHHNWLKSLPPILIDSKKVGYGLNCYVIAEVGVNHNGKLGLALRLIDAAAATGADAVKFQTFRAKQVVISNQPVFSYHKRNTKRTDQAEMLKKLELKERWYPLLIARAKKRKITFLSTPHGSFASVDFLTSLGIPAFKFGSGDLSNLPLLYYTAKIGKPMIISTGMGTMNEVKAAIRKVRSAGNNQIVVLHCVTYYPTRDDQVNLNAMLTMMKELNVLVGYSSNGLGTQVETMAATLGACIVEKQLTLDRKMEGPDHKASLEPTELSSMVRQIRNVSVILGSPIKKPVYEETETAKLARKSVVTTHNIKKGEIFTTKNIDIKRPGIGLVPSFFQRIIGKRAGRNIKADSLLKLSDF